MAEAVRIETLSKTYHLGLSDRKALWHSLRLRLTGRPDDKLFWALRDISFSVREGEVLGILGHNGAGKSTLLKILSQITAPTSGRVLVKGRVASLLEVGTGFHQELSGRDNTFLNGAILGMSRREVAAKFDEIVAFAQVEEFIDTPVKRYSNGMRMRLAFAIAAHLDPEVMIIDEVLAVGDTQFQQRCIGKIGEVAGRGRTVLFVSHNTAAVENLCTRGVVLDHGQLLFDGNQSDAIRFYAKRGDQTGASLRTRQNREGSGQVRLVSLELRSHGQAIKAIPSGEELEVILGFERHGADRYPALTADLEVRTHLGTMVFTQSNWFTHEHFGDLPEAGRLICRIPRLPLGEGSYQLSVVLYPQRRFLEPLDSVYHAADLQVIKGNFFGTGRVSAPRDGATLVPGSWRLEPELAGEPASVAPAQVAVTQPPSAS